MGPNSTPAPMSELSEADIKRLVNSFYARIRQDERLAPIFATKIKSGDWDAHMDHIADFWASIFLKTRQFSGNPMQKHTQITGITPAHFTHWLALFHDTAKQVLSTPQADEIHEMAQRIGQSLQMGLAFHYEKSGQMDHPFTGFGIKPRE